MRRRGSAGGEVRHFRLRVGGDFSPGTHFARALPTPFPRRT